MFVLKCNFYYCCAEYIIIFYGKKRILFVRVEGNKTYDHIIFSPFHNVPSQIFYILAIFASCQRSVARTSMLFGVWS